MPNSLTTQQLTAIEKSMLGIVDDPEKGTAIKGAFAEFQKALADGIPVGSDEVDQAIEVLLEPVAKGAAPQGDVEMPEDPLAPIFDNLFQQMQPIAKRAGVAPVTFEAMFHKAYGDALRHLDATISATAEAVATELGAADVINFGKARRRHEDDDDDDDDDDDGDGDGDGDDMEKMAKRLGLPDALVKRIGTMQAELAALTHDKAMSLFTKRAEKIGEPGMAADLLALHEVDPELCARVEKSLASKNAILRKNTAWAQEIGSGRDTQAEGAGAALDQLNGMAKEIQKVQKGRDNRPISFAKAFSMACEQNPELYAEYNQQKQREIARGY